MREIYACQLDLLTGPTPAVEAFIRAEALVREWVARGSGVSASDLSKDGQSESADSIVDVERIEEDSDGAGDGWACDWRRNSERDQTLQWRTQAALSRVGERALRFTVRIGLERSGSEFLFRQPQYEFRSPTIVRTLAREFECVDAGQVLQPEPIRFLANEARDLVDLLRDKRRRLPVVVVTTYPPTGKPLAESDELARQLAGIAHVAVLETHLAALAFSDLVGRDLSVWHGGVRLYWPGFEPGDNPRKYRYWPARVLQEQPDSLVAQLNRWLGSQAALSAPEHPATLRARQQRRQRLADSGEELPAWVTEYVQEVERELDTLKRDNELLNAELGDAQQNYEQANSELVAVRQEFSNLARLYGQPSDSGEIDWTSVTVLEAYEEAKERSGPRVIFLPNADRSVSGFLTYRNPRRLFDSLMAICDAADAWQSGALGAGFGDYFASRGYEYSARNPAASARATRNSYRVPYEGNTVTLEPHLKVDQATSPDQCLRIYWHIDDVNKLLVIGHVGRHLPD
ncbi:hypothetical protein ACN27J_14870 [Solwaraspora sp. WMMB762]|uniref:hypothetical protein n=1 Tax=Solwaraspora sp. WMMB762 TaxID=3404120 RepID=UPI003B9421A1